MPDKKRELHYVDALQPALPDFPSGAHAGFETPDVLIHSGSSTTGIEVTVFHHPGQPGARPHQGAPLPENAIQSDQLVARLEVEVFSPYDDRGWLMYVFDRGFGRQTS